MAKAVDRNRLADAHSPYLHQHADNPVHWQPWDDEALTAASELDRPIFLSIGYAACHWCHVMEDESFQDPDIAAVLNDCFVPIKVDREERPDLDRIYQTICQLVTASGGWPLSAWLTPDGRPFYIGTYFPPESAHGRPGFREVLDRVNESWEHDRSALEERADQWHAAIRDELESTQSGTALARPSGADRLVQAADAAVRSADRQHGGFGNAGPKFPQPRRLELLLRAARRTDNTAYRDVTAGALESMANRGLYDQVGGGFHRYATDRAWEIPHFEKMLYDNAELPRIYVNAYQLGGPERYATVVEETLAFVERELRHPDGGWYSTLDAQSEGREGAFYVWSPAEVADVLADDVTTALFCARFGITDEGNFERGTSVPRISRGIEALANEFEMEAEEVRGRLLKAREQIREAREARERPKRDEKILAGWNGLMLSTVAEAAIVLDRRYLRRARDTLSFLAEHHWDADRGRLSRRYLDGTVGIEGYLDDYAYLAKGAFDVYQASGELPPLAFAVDLTRAMVGECWDADAETLYFTPESGEALITRPSDLPDQSLPSSVGVAVEVMAQLHAFVPDEGLLDIVEAVLRAHGARIESAPLQHSSLVMARDLVQQGGWELTIAAESVPDEWQTFIAETYLPGRVLSRRPPANDDLDEWLDALGLEDAPPIWAERTPRGGKATAYLCRDFTCSPPLTDPDAARDWLHRLSSSADPD